MKFLLKPLSLQDLTLVKISAELWNTQHAIWTQMAECLIKRNDIHKHPNYEEGRSIFVEECRKMQEKVREKASTLPLPVQCKQLLQKFLQTIGKEIYDWFVHHYDCKDDVLFRNNFPNRQCWTGRGTIDYKRTAKLLVKNEDLCIKKRYELACINCLEKNIRDLFPRIPEDYKKELLETIPDRLYYRGTIPLRLTKKELTMFWTWTLSGKDKLDRIFPGKKKFSFYQKAYFRTASKANLAAGEYFFEKLSPYEKYVVLVDAPKGNPEALDGPHDHMNIIASYLSEISEEHQERYFQIAAGDVLRLLKNWPWQGYFMEAALRLIRFVKMGKYNIILDELCGKIEDRCVDYDYFQLFREFGFLNRSFFKIYFHDPGDFVKQIFRPLKEELSKFILKEANDDQKQRFEARERLLVGPMEMFNHFLRVFITKYLMEKSIVSIETLIKCRRNFELDYLNELDECGTSKHSDEKRFRFVVLDCMVELRSKKPVL